MTSLVQQYFTSPAVSQPRAIAHLALLLGGLYIASRTLRAAAHALFPSKFPGQAETELLATPVVFSQADVGAKELSGVKAYDYIIAGGGTAGIVLAARLSEDPKVSVLVIEAGYSDLKQLYSRIPAGFAKLFTGANDWNYSTTPQSNANGRKFYWPRGKALGGCSSINAMIYNVGSPADYDEWEQKCGMKGWGYSSMAHLVKRATTFTPRPGFDVKNSNLGKDGPWQISYSYTSKLCKPFIKACDAVGIPEVACVNTEKGIAGASTMQTFIDQKGQRSSTATAYLDHATASRSNLHIAVGQTVTRVIFDRTVTPPRAIGVEMAASKHAPLSYRARARKEVIVCGGAIASPTLLMCSGVGPAEHLRSKNIDVVADVPGVGQNLHDHLFIPAIARVHKGMSLQFLANDIKSIPALVEWIRKGTGPLTSNVAEACSFLSATEREDCPKNIKNLMSGPGSADLELLSGPVCYVDHGRSVPTDYSDYAAVGAIHLRPEGRGSIRLDTRNIFDAPLIDPAYLSTESDRAMMLYGLKLCRKVIENEQYGAFKSWYRPSFEESTDEQLEEYIRNESETIYHPAGTCQAGDFSANPNAVVDHELKVRNVTGLRVCDVSIQPHLIAGHPCASAVLTGEKLAEIIKQSPK
ncbi:hypothetical protein E5Q_06549 [Mixia osmundae IAM 14324]|uniref:Glucose-methanol-choline oxidoreductase N-terminal domain-containing protein n=1 Tax=Mixia osmundae (strain CBS 9802 / IAM 14324 / JCM 22182 / KY 12970) TaxID=764103 RepID=G7EAI6_MIXOS|nr:hypothetical protein E5Q_06549 [Mixia osmundae IAM 14324]